LQKGSQTQIWGKIFEQKFGKQASTKKSYKIFWEKYVHKNCSGENKLFEKELADKINGQKYVQDTFFIKKFENNFEKIILEINLKINFKEHSKQICPNTFQKINRANIFPFLIFLIFLKFS